MIRTSVIICLIPFVLAFLGIVTLAGVSRVKPRVDSLDRWRAERDARKAGLL